MVSAKFKCLQTNGWIILWCHVFIRKPGRVKVSTFYSFLTFSSVIITLIHRMRYSKDLFFYLYSLSPLLLTLANQFPASNLRNWRFCNCKSKRNIAFLKQLVIRKKQGEGWVICRGTIGNVFFLYFNLQMPFPVI